MFISSRTVGAIFNRPNHCFNRNSCKSNFQTNCRLSECIGNLFTVLITSVAGDCKSPLHAMSFINEYKVFISSRTVGAIFNRPNHCFNRNSSKSNSQTNCRLSECIGNLFTVLITSVAGDCKSPLHAMSFINEYKVFISSRTVGAIFNRPNHCFNRNCCKSNSQTNCYVKKRMAPFGNHPHNSNS